MSYREDSEDEDGVLVRILQRIESLERASMLPPGHRMVINDKGYVFSVNSLTGEATQIGHPL